MDGRRSRLPMRPHPRAHTPRRCRGSSSRRRRLLASIIFVVSIVAFLYFVLPKLVGLQDTWNRIEHGNAWWFAVAAVLEVLSFGGYIMLFRAVFVRPPSRIDWRESYQITMAGLAATRLFAAGGAGGLALTGWALRRSGLDARIAACRMVAFMVMLYAVFMITLVIDGLGLYLGIIPSNGAPFAITVIPAIFGAGVIAVFLPVSLLPGDFERLVASVDGRGPTGYSTLARDLAALPAAVGTGVRTAIELSAHAIRRCLGAIAWWAFDIAHAVGVLSRVRRLAAEGR